MLEARFEGEASIEIVRDEAGVCHVVASTESDLYRGLGYCHGTDRALQLLLMRILGRGRASEILESSDEMLRLDTFFRGLDLARDVEAELAKIQGADRDRFLAYCDGVNRALAQVPWELRWLGYSPEPWIPADTVLLARMTGFVALAQSQGEIERFFLELLQAGVPPHLLSEMFPVELDAAQVDLLSRVQLTDRLLPDEVRFGTIVAKAVASNNWVVAPSRTASGRALLANDPHLETNRLPAVWYEVVLELGERYCIAATMPGLPAPILGRTNDLAWGATYTFMDAIDSWVEECRDGACRRVTEEGEAWIPLSVRVETIARKGASPVEVRFHENEHGLLAVDPNVPGFYLATRWASGSGTGARSLASQFGMLWATSVEEGRALLGQIETAWNWVLADRDGRIGYQMSGLMPIRRPGWNGFVPQPGWDAANDWRGFVAPEDLPRAIDPPCGYIVTANDDLNHLGRTAPINVAMGSYRAERIAARLAQSRTWDVEATLGLQLDEHSLQAERLLPDLLPHVPPGATGDLLRSWDCGYGVESRAATLFEDIYRDVIAEVLGLGAPAAREVLESTALLADFYACFDRIVFAPESRWFEPEGRDAMLARVVRRVVARAEESGRVERWGERQRITMTHLALGGRLPRWLGFDYGPTPLPGGRATVRQGQVYRSGGRTTSFAPSYRLVTDFAEHAAHTALAGGPSDRRFSRWYVSGIDDWRAGKLKRVRPSSPPAPALRVVADKDREPAVLPQPKGESRRRHG